MVLVMVLGVSLTRMLVEVVLKERRGGSVRGAGG